MTSNAAKGRQINVSSSKRKTLQKLVAIGFISKPYTLLDGLPIPAKVVRTKSPLCIG